METIEEMVKRGQAAIEARNQAKVNQWEEELRQKREDWQRVQAEVRLAFPEAVQEYVFLDQAKQTNPSGYPEAIVMSPAIEIAGYAPISCNVARDPEGKWIQIHDKKQDYVAHRTFYSIPRAYKDWEVGVCWSWRDGEYTNSLEEALAYAKRFQEEREKMERREDLDRVAKIDEAQYLPVIEERNPTLMDQLVELIRDVVREEIARGVA